MANILPPSIAIYSKMNANGGRRGGRGGEEFI